MINYLTNFVYTNSVAFPNTLTINATGAGTGDGTELIKKFGDNIWGVFQALLDAAGLTPDNVTEAPGTSQVLEAIRKISGSPGEGVIWWKDSDPAITGDRVILLNGQGVLRATYPELDAAVYVGDIANPTASAFYHADDAAGTIRNTTGIYLILPDTRGYALRGLDTSGGIDPDGAGRDAGSIQGFALEDFSGYIDFYRNAWQEGSTPSGVFSVANAPTGADVELSPSGAGTPRRITFSAAGDAVTATETRMINIATKFGIRY